MGELERMGQEISSDRAWASRKEVLAVRELTLRHNAVVALTPQQFEVYMAYE